mmetsp:Transcript_9045/g.20899  ORF Transcript_9045/g.20899 Transcript_9045/m.20899 type:complete len:140 (+) Transcript_9045:577-996(+)
MLISFEESKTEFLDRCDKSMKALHRRFPYSPRTAIVIVTHAATCIGLARAAANLTLADVNPVGPCSLFRLTRTSNVPEWKLDPFDKLGGFNGYSDHISDKGIYTTPWNHFGKNRQYTGPPKDDIPIANGVRESKKKDEL